jgi:repressor LexA
MRVIDIEKYGEIVEFIDDYFLNSGQPPNVREVAAAVGMTATRAARYLRCMGEAGVIEYDAGKQRGAITEKMKKTRCGSRCIPVVGSIACGTPATAEENIDRYISVSTEFLEHGRYYFLRASGDSMIDVGIDDGDLVLIREQEEAEDGQIVVALTPDGESTLKRFYRDMTRRMIRLHPENGKIKDIFVKDCRVQGVAIKVIKDLL